MTLRRIAFDDITPESHCLSDASTIADLADQATNLTAPLDERHANWILRSPDEFGLRASLLVIERWIVTDDIVVDAVAVDSLQHGEAIRTFRWEPQSRMRDAFQIEFDREHALLEHIDATLLQTSDITKPALRAVQNICHLLDIAFTIVPYEVVEVIGRLVDHASAAVRRVAPDEPWSEYGFGLDKRYGEVLQSLYHGRADLARSNIGIERTIYYYELAASAQVPLLLHPSRHNEALALAAAAADAYEAVKATITTKFEEPLRDQLSQRSVPWDLAVPPLARLLVRSAGQQRASIIDVAKQIKASAHASDFRKWLSELQIQLATNSQDGRLHALKCLREIEQVSASWLAEFDIQQGVTHNRRRLELSWVPRIGALLAQLGGMSIDDPILNRKGYLTFISMWHKSPPADWL